MLIVLVAGGVLAGVLLLVFLLRRWARMAAWPLLLLVVALLFGGLRVWSAAVTRNDPARIVRGDPPPRGDNKTLIVLVHGLGGGVKDVKEVQDYLAGLKQEDWSRLDPPPAEGAAKRSPEIGAADLLVVDYGNSYGELSSNTRVMNVARGVNLRIRDAVKDRPYTRIVVVGYSMGATVARAAFLDASGRAVGDGPAEPADWAKKVSRFVLLAGMNRGWDFSGLKPSDMFGGKYGLFRACTNVGRWADVGHLHQDTEAGSPFLTGVRLEWMNLARERGDDMPGTVQLLGDIDDLVSDADNKDLGVTSASRFASLRVRGTGHSEIVELGGDARPRSAEKTLGGFRAEKIHLAITKSFDVLQAATEELPYQVDRVATRVVFVVHGIRDLGEWSASFEESLQKGVRTSREKAVELAAGRDGPAAKLVIVAPRYGYLPMGPFLLPPVRQRYVRGFVDAYTETLARYPEARSVNAIGHSNGTHLITSALKNYPAVKLDRVVLGNAVVRQDYPWNRLLDDRHRQVNAVRNYVTSDDEVVALFPRFFEGIPGRWLGNDIGGAGFTGFHEGTGKGVTNVVTIRGGHSALHLEVKERREDINTFLFDGRSETSETLRERKPGLDWLSIHCYLVWGLLAVVLVAVGYGLLLFSAGSGLRLIGRDWIWLATLEQYPFLKDLVARRTRGCWTRIVVWGVGGWVIGSLRLVGALVCLLLVLAFFFTARESLLFVLVVALLSGWVLRRLSLAALGPVVAVPPALRPLEVMPAVLAGGLCVSFLVGNLSDTGYLGGLAELGWLLLAALAVVPFAVVFGLGLTALRPARAESEATSGRTLAIQMGFVLVFDLLAAVDWHQIARLIREGARPDAWSVVDWLLFGQLVGVFGLGFLLVTLARGPLADASETCPPRPPVAPPLTSGWLFGHAFVLLLAPIYLAVAGYVLLIH